MIQFLSDDGVLLKAHGFSEDALVSGYEALVRARFFDERAVVLHRQGRLGVYPPYFGQEASQVGMALALAQQDWLVPSYRETAAALTHGLSMAQIILYWRSHPAGWRFPEGVNVLPFYIPIATQLPQAVGIAHAGSLQGVKRVVATFVGDGGSSEGDFHEALNFASVFCAPVVFMVQNNGWAISVPTSAQMKHQRIADRASGYGMPGVLVDGNDLLAVWHVANEAAERARAGDGPTLIEALTYRVAPHTTSDDPSRYRTDEASDAWVKKDPVTRMRAFMQHEGLWDDSKEQALQQNLKAELDAALKDADAAADVMPWEIVEHVFEQMSPEQQRAWEALHEQS